MAHDSTHRRRKALALLAGGLVLGVGTAGTLAAWNDSEFATGRFDAGSFDLEGSETGATAGYADHESAPGAPLQFTLALASNLSPADTVYAPFWLRLDQETTSGAEVTAAAVTASGDNAANLAWTVHAIAAAATCDATAATTGTALASGATLSTITKGASLDLEIGAEGEAGAPVQLCFAVTAGEGLAEGKDATATWSFSATSR